MDMMSEYIIRTQHQTYRVHLLELSDFIELLIRTDEQPLEIKLASL